MKIALGADHGGFEYKNKISDMLQNEGYDVTDFGTYSQESCDYPIFAKKVAEAVSGGLYDRGILICGTGIGMSIAANKFKGIRAALCSDTFSAKATREHNDSNILCMGARVISFEKAEEITRIWLETPFSQEERHIRRIGMIE
ncbi:MAG: ribose 5-phosphate isomerase B [Candidatus Gastranaerophilaceae bacterium]|nr:ribose 5-phosphate isomerase B [Candidatus Gastranaerophilaceae bacterium]